MRFALIALALMPLSLVACGGGGHNATAATGGGEEVFRVPSGSMEPTFSVGSRVPVKRGLAPAIGTVVILHPPQGAEQQLCGPRPHTVKLGGAACERSIGHEDTGTSFIKRIVAGPGDTISIKGGHVYRRARGASRTEREHDPYIRACRSSTECNFPIPITIPAGEWFVMGDNRGESDDSRFWGPVPTSWIVGRVVGPGCRPLACN